MEAFLKTLIKSSTPQPKAQQTRTATSKGKPKVPPKPAFSVPLPDDDWEEELAVPIPSPCKSKMTPDLEQRQVFPGRTLQRADPAHHQETALLLYSGRQKETHQGIGEVETSARLERVGGRRSSVNSMARTTRRRRRRRMVGRELDVQKWLAKTGIELHWPDY